MIAFESERNNNDNNPKADWQTNFATMLSEIEHRLNAAFGNLDAASREEATAEGVMHALLAYVRLHEQDRVHVATPSTLAWYSSRQVKQGRPAAGRMNGKEPLSRYGQLSNDIKVERRPNSWIDAIVADKRASVSDQVAAKMDVGAWFATLTQSMRQIAKDLAFGFSTSEVARKHGLTAGRISQLRRKLAGSWRAFQQESDAAFVL
jgi:hypothetical protein